MILSLQRLIFLLIGSNEVFGSLEGIVANGALRFEVVDVITVDFGVRRFVYLGLVEEKCLELLNWMHDYIRKMGLSDSMEDDIKGQYDCIGDKKIKSGRRGAL